MDGKTVCEAEKQEAEGCAGAGLMSPEWESRRWALGRAGLLFSLSSQELELTSWPGRFP